MNSPIIKRILSALIAVAFLATASPCPLLAQELILPAPGSMVHLSPKFNPATLKGLKVHPDNPFKFDFILDQGDSSQTANALKDESTKLIKYFLSSLTIPEGDLWVNLSPYEKDRIVPESFGQTDMGRDLLAQDYLLKQITASLIYPEDEVGKRFWDKVYKEAQSKFHTTNIPINTFNKVWIVPNKALVYENAKAGTAYVVESSLKVMLEEDYLALDKNAKAGDASFGFAERRSSLGMGAGLELDGSLKELRAPKDERAAGPASLASQIIREIVIPELTKEINKGKNFAQLRQVYNSLILATWYKKKIKSSILSKVYQDQKKIKGITIDNPQDKQLIYEQYLRAFKNGVYNYIKEEQDPVTQAVTPRKYFSGGVSTVAIGRSLAMTSDGDTVENNDRTYIVESDLVASAAMNVVNAPKLFLPSSDEAKKVYDLISKNARDGWQDYFERYVAGVANADKDKDITKNISLIRFLFQANKLLGRMREFPILKDENGQYWLLKKRDKEFNHLRRERFAYLLAHDRGEYTEVRELDSNERKIVSGEGLYLSRLVMPDNGIVTNKRWTAKDVYNRNFVMNILLGLADPWYRNMVELNGTSIRIDSDLNLIASIDYGYELSDYANARESATTSFLMHAVYDLVQTSVDLPIPDKIDLLPGVKDFMGIHKADSYSKLSSIFKRYGIGHGFVAAESLDPELIRKYIKQFNKITNKEIKDKLKQVGYSGEDLRIAVEMLKRSRDNLGAEMDKVWTALTGEDLNFRLMDKAMVGVAQKIADYIIYGNPIMARYNSKITTRKWFIKSHLSKLYHDIFHSIGVGDLAYNFAKNRGLSEVDAVFLKQIGYVHDYDPNNNRLPDTPARVWHTLKELPVLGKRFGWTPLQLLKAKAIIQRSEYPFWPPKKVGDPYKIAREYVDANTNPLEEYKKLLREIKQMDPSGATLRFVLEEGAYFSEYIDKTEVYGRNNFPGAYKKIREYALEKTNDGSTNDTKSFEDFLLKNTAFFFSMLRVDRDRELAESEEFNVKDINFIELENALEFMPENIRANIEEVKEAFGAEAAFRVALEAIEKSKEKSDLLIQGLQAVAQGRANSTEDQRILDKLKKESVGRDNDMTDSLIIINAIKNSIMLVTAAINTLNTPFRDEFKARNSNVVVIGEFKKVIALRRALLAGADRAMMNHPDKITWNQIFLMDKNMEWVMDWGLDIKYAQTFIRNMKSLFPTLAIEADRWLSEQLIKEGNIEIPPAWEAALRDLSKRLAPMRSDMNLIRFYITRDDVNDSNLLIETQKYLSKDSPLTSIEPKELRLKMDAEINRLAPVFGLTAEEVGRIKGNLFIIEQREGQFFSSKESNFLEISKAVYRAKMLTFQNTPAIFAEYKPELAFSFNELRILATKVAADVVYRHRRNSYIWPAYGRLPEGVKQVVIPIAPEQRDNPQVFTAEGAHAIFEVMGDSVIEKDMASHESIEFLARQARGESSEKFRAYRTIGAWLYKELGNISVDSIHEWRLKNYKRTGGSTADIFRVLRLPPVKIHNKVKAILHAPGMTRHLMARFMAEQHDLLDKATETLAREFLRAFQLSDVSVESMLERDRVLVSHALGAYIASQYISKAGSAEKALKVVAKMTRNKDKSWMGDYQSFVEKFDQASRAMAAALISSSTGGIDLNAVDKDLKVKLQDGEIVFDVDPAMLMKFKDTPGFSPVIINIRPANDLRSFLGITNSV